MPASSLAEQTQGKYSSNKDNHCCDSFEFIALSIDSSSFTESFLCGCEVEVQHRMDEVVGHSPSYLVEDRSQMCELLTALKPVVLVSVEPVREQ